MDRQTDKQTTHILLYLLRYGQVYKILYLDNFKYSLTNKSTDMFDGQPTVKSQQTGIETITDAINLHCAVKST